MERLGLPKGQIREALPYKGKRPEVGREVLGELIYHMNFTDAAGLTIAAVRNMIIEGIAANNDELTKQLSQEIEDLRREVESLRGEPAP